MPYSADVYTLPPGTTATTLTPIDSSDYNAFIADIEAAQNAARPVVAGGTGGTTAITGHDALVTKGTTIASAGTLNLDNADAAFLDVSGTTTVTAVTLTAGRQRVVQATGAFQMTAGASLIVNGSTTINFTTTAGDLLLFEGYAAGVVRVWVIGSTQRMTGQYPFPAAQNASSNVNTLDDYEEGTFTPTIAFGGAAVGVTYSNQLGTYTKIGNRCFGEIRMVLTAKGSSTGAVTIEGFPFTIFSRGAMAVGTVSNMTGLTGALVATLNTSTTTSNLRQTTATGNANITDANITATLDMAFSFEYQV